MYAGYSIVLLYIAIGLDVVFMALSCWRGHANTRTAIKYELYPFHNTIQLLKFHRRLPSFPKERYNQQLKRRTIRNPFENAVLHFYSRLSWLIFLPFMLLSQSLPETYITVEIRKL